MCKTFFIFTADGKEEEIETVGVLEKHLGIKRYGTDTQKRMLKAK